MERLEGDKIPKEYDDYKLKGKKKLSKKQKKVVDAIKNIHKTIEGWDETDDRISIRRYKQNMNRSVFAVSNDGEIVGYATATKKEGDKYYLSFIAVNKEKQSSGIGRTLLLRVIEKVKKRGGKVIYFDYEDSEKLNDFYNSDKIPCEKEFVEHDHKFRGSGHWVNKMTYYLK